MYPSCLSLQKISTYDCVYFFGGITMLTDKEQLRGE
jgi:hypothetical protein